MKRFFGAAAMARAATMAVAAAVATITTKTMTSVRIFSLVYFRHCKHDKDEFAFKLT